MHAYEKGPINWLNVIFLSSTPILALILIPWYGFTVGFHLYEWLCFFAYMAFTGLAITAGYHRLWAHKAYKTHWSIRLWHAIWGAAACQNSILAWASDHRIHHRFVDEPDKDPYAATNGFWFSHIGWIFRNNPRHVTPDENSKDLMRDPIVMWQHKHFWKINFAVNGGLTLALGLAVDRMWGVFLLAFLLRTVLNHHFTFFINSLAHIWGSRPYSDQNTARDNPFLALVTYGEGYHNFHHAFQSDYRNGVRWWHFDPSKWIIKTCSWVGLARDLKETSKEQIERARVKMQMKRAMLRLNTHGVGSSHVEQLKEALETKAQALQASLAEWQRIKKKWLAAKKARMAKKWDKRELRDRYYEMKYAIALQRKQWKLLLKDLANAQQLAIA